MDHTFADSRYELKMKQTEERMRALGLLTPSCVLTLDEWEIPRDRVVINRKLGEGAFGTVYGGEAFFDEKGWVSQVDCQVRLDCGRSGLVRLGWVGLG